MHLEASDHKSNKALARNPTVIDMTPKLEKQAKTGRPCARINSAVRNGLYYVVVDRLGGCLSRLSARLLRRPKPVVAAPVIAPPVAAPAPVRELPPELKAQAILDQVRCSLLTLQSLRGKEGSVTETLNTLREQLRAAAAIDPTFIPDAQPLRDAAALITRINNDPSEWHAEAPAIPTRALIPRDTAPETSDYILAHLLGDQWSRGTHLEDERPAEVLNYVISLLPALSDHLQRLVGDKVSESKIKTLIKLLKRTASIENRATQFPKLAEIWRRDGVGKAEVSPINELTANLDKEMRDALSQMGRFVFAGGRRGQTVYLDIVKQANKQYTVCVCSRRAGLPYHGAPTEYGYKSLYPCVLEIQNVGEGCLLNPRFLRGLIELKTVTSGKPHSSDPEIEYSEVDLYEGLLPMLGGKVVNRTMEYEDLMGSHLGKTGDWTALTVIFRRQLGYEASKMLVYLMRHQALWNYYEHNDPKLVTSRDKRAYFDRSLDHLQRELSALQRLELITTDTHHQHIDALDTLRNHLQVRRQEDVFLRTRKVPYESVDAVWVSAPEVQSTKPASAPEPEPIRPQSYGEAVRLMRSVSTMTFTPDSLAPQLRQLTPTFLRMAAEGHHDHVAQTFQVLMMRLPTPVDSNDPLYGVFSKRADLQTVRQLKYDLEELHDCYFRALHLKYDPTATPSAFIVAAHQSMAILDRIISLNAVGLGLPEFVVPPDYNMLALLLGEEPRLDFFTDDERFYYLRLSRTDRDMQFQLSSPDLYDRVRKIHHYLTARANSHKGSPLAFLRRTGTDRYEDFAVYISNVYNSHLAQFLEQGHSRFINPEFAYVSRLVRSDPKLAARIGTFQHGSEAVDFAKLNLNQQIGHVYCSNLADTLSPEFIRWRRTVYQTQHLTAGPVARPTPEGRKDGDGPDLSIDLHYHYGRHEQSGHYLSIYTRVAGVATHETGKRGALVVSNRVGRASIQHKRFATSMQPEEPRFREVLRTLETYNPDEHQVSSLVGGHRLSLGYTNHFSIPQFMAYVTLGTSPALQPLNTLTQYRLDLNEFGDKSGQALFTLLFFERDLLPHCCELAPGFIPKGLKILRELHEYYLDQGQAATCLLAISASRHLLRYLPLGERYLAGVTQQGQAVAMDGQTELSRLAALGLTPEERTLWYQEWIAHTGEKGRYTDSELRQLLLALNHIDTHPTRAEWRRPFLLREVESRVRASELDLLHLMEQDPASLLKDLLAANGYTAPEGRWTQLSPTQFKSADGVYQIDIVTGHLLVRGGGQRIMSPLIVAHKDYQFHFDKAYTATYIGENTYKFALEDGSLVELTDAGKDLRVRRQVEGRWCQEWPSRCFGRYLPTKFSYWLPEKADCLYLTNKQGKVCFHIELDAQRRVQKVTNTEGPEPLSVIDLSPVDGPYRFLKDVEGMDSVLVMHDQNKQPARIKLLRSGQSFTARDGRWYSDQHEGFSLRDQQSVPILDMIGYRAYLHFEKEDQQFILLTGTAYNAQRGTSTIGPVPSVFDISSERRPISIELQRDPARAGRRLAARGEAALKLAYIGLASGDPLGYQLARTFLDDAHLRLTRSKTEMAQDSEILLWLQRFRDQCADGDARATALWLRITYLIALRSNPPPSEKHDFSQALTEYVVYTLSQYPNYRLETPVFAALCRNNGIHTGTHLRHTLSPEAYRHLRDVSPLDADQLNTGVEAHKTQHVRPTALTEGDLRQRRSEYGMALDGASWKVPEGVDRFDMSFMFSRKQRMTPKERQILLQDANFLITRPSDTVMAHLLFHVLAVVTGKVAEKDGRLVDDLLHLTRGDVRLERLRAAILFIRNNPTIVAFITLTEWDKVDGAWERVVDLPGASGVVKPLRMSIQDVWRNKSDEPTSLEDDDKTDLGWLGTAPKIKELIEKWETVEWHRQGDLFISWFATVSMAAEAFGKVPVARKTRLTAGEHRRPKPRALVLGTKAPRSVEPPALYLRTPLIDRIVDCPVLNVDDYLMKPTEDLLRQQQQQQAAQLKKLDTVEQRLAQVLVPSKHRVAQRETVRLQDACEQFVAARRKALQSAEPKRRLDPTQMARLKEDLQLRIDIMRNRIDAEERSLEVTINRPSDDDLAKRFKRMGLVASGRSEDLSINDCLVLLARGEISSEAPLFHCLQSFLDQAVGLQRLERGQKKLLEALQGVSEAEIEMGLTRVLEELDATCVFDPAKRPYLRVLEYWANVSIWKEQLDTLDLMMKARDGEPIFIQRKPGAGKTTVLEVLLAFLLADGKRLMIVAAPAAQFDSMGDQLTQRLGRLARQVVVQLRFDRSDAGCQPIQLKETADRLVDVRVNRQCLFVDPIDLHCLFLKYSEIWCVPSDRTAQVAQLTEMRPLIAGIRKHAAALFDEVDIPNNPFTEVNFPTGPEKQLTDEEMDTIEHVYGQLLDSDAVRDLISCQFDHMPRDKTAPLYRAETWPEVRMRLGKEVLKALVNPPMAPGNDTTDALYVKRTEVSRFFAQLTSEHTQLLVTFVFQKPLDGKEELEAAQLDAAQTWQKSLPRPIRNVLAVLKEQLQTLLPVSLEKNCGEHFDDSETHVATPREQGRPIPNAQFANPLILANLTMALWRDKPIPLAIISKAINALQSQCLLQISDGKKVSETSAHASFKQIVGADSALHLMRVKDPEILQIAKLVTESPAVRWRFIRTYILTEIRFHTRKASSNGHSLGWLLKDKQGFAGQLAYPDAYPRDVTVVRDAQTDAELLTMLLTPSDVEGAPALEPVIISDVASPKCLRDTALALLRRGVPVRAVVDQAGWINGIDYDAMASEWLGMMGSDIQGLAYHNVDNKLQMREKANGRLVPFTASALDKNKRLTVYRQPWATGEDILQALFGVVVVTVGPTITFRDLVQSAYRMRQLGQGQRAIFLIDKKMEHHVRATLGLAPNAEITETVIVRFALLNQFTHAGECNLWSTKQAMLWTAQRVIFEASLDMNIQPADLPALATPEVCDLLWPETPHEACDVYSDLEISKPSEEVLEVYAKTCIDLVTAAVKSSETWSQRIDVSKVEREIRGLIRPEILPEETVHRRSNDLNQHSFVQQKARVNTIVTAVNAVHKKDEHEFFQQWKYFPWPVEAWRTGRMLEHSFVVRGTPYMRSMKDWVNEQTDLKALADALSPALKVSVNIATPAHLEAGRTVKALPMVTTIIRQVLLVQDTGTRKWEVYLLSQKDIEYFLKDLRKAPKGSLRIGVYNLAEGFVLQSTIEKVSNKDVDASPELQNLLAQVYFYTGGRSPHLKIEAAQAAWILKHDRVALGNIRAARIMKGRPQESLVQQPLHIPAASQAATSVPQPVVATAHPLSLTASTMQPVASQAPVLPTVARTRQAHLERKESKRPEGKYSATSTDS